MAVFFLSLEKGMQSFSFPNILDTYGSELRLCAFSANGPESHYFAYHTVDLCALVLCLTFSLSLFL